MRRAAFVLGVACFVVSACGDDDAGPPLPSGDRLNLRLSSTPDGYELVDGDPQPV